SNNNSSGNGLASSNPQASSAAANSSAVSSVSTSSAGSSGSAAAPEPAPDMSPNPGLPLKGTPNYTLAGDIARFLTQSTFGPTPKEIMRVMNMGKEAWLEEQFALPPTRHLPLL